MHIYIIRRRAGCKKRREVSARLRDTPFYHFYKATFHRCRREIGPTYQSTAQDRSPSSYESLLPILHFAPPVSSHRSDWVGERKRLQGGKEFVRLGWCFGGRTMGTLGLCRDAGGWVGGSGIGCVCRWVHGLCIIAAGWAD